VPVDPPTDSLQSASALDQFSDPASSALDRLWDEEWEKALLAAALERVRRQVNPKHFQIFDLCVLQHWPPAQVARTLGVSTARVYLAKHRVGALFKKAIRQVEEHWSRIYETRRAVSS